MADITLTASMRSNLLSLQNTQSLMDMTQERLSTGNKVNSAIDNPSSYYTAQSLNNRASDLSALLDSMGQAVQTIKAANEGIEAITSFVEQAKAVANTAMDTADADQIKSSQEQFNNIRDQINKLAKDSGYKGINLLQGDELNVIFNEDRSSFIKIDGAFSDTSEQGLDIAEATDWTKVSDTTAGLQTTYDNVDKRKTEVKVTEAAGENAGDSPVFTAVVADAEYDTLMNADGTKSLKTAFTEAVGTYNTKYEAAYEAAYTAASAGGETDPEKLDKAGKEAAAADEDVIAAKEAMDAAQSAYATAVETAHKEALEAADKDLKAAQAQDIKDNKENIRASVDDTTNAINKLRSMASTFGNNYSIVETRESFTDSLINVLTEGADKLTLADMNEASANMLALQTRQQLAINSLSLASQAAQGVLKLF